MQDKLEMPPDAVGRVCEMMLELKQHPLDETTYKMLVMFVVGPHEECPRAFVNALWSARVMVERMKLQFGQAIDMRVACLIAMECENVVGRVLMYGYLIRYLCKRDGIAEYGIDDLCRHFPMGFYSAEDLHKIWDMQKYMGGGSDNLIDHREAAESLV